jgi:hypothetical protein
MVATATTAPGTPTPIPILDSVLKPSFRSVGFAVDDKVDVELTVGEEVAAELTVEEEVVE